MTVCTIRRRLRHAPPNPTVRRLAFTDADLVLFGAIDRHGPLPSHYLYEFTKHLRRDRTHLQNRLTEFYNGDADGFYLTRPRQQFASYSGRYQHVVYDLAPRARLALAERDMLAGSAPRIDPFVHRLMTACVTASFELAAPMHGFRFISLKDILDHPRCGAAAQSRTPLAFPGSPSVIPDALFGIEYPGTGFRFFALEIDRNTESIERKNLGQSAFATKVHGYRHVLREQRYKAWWGVPNLSILTVTTSATHARNLVAFLRRHLETDYQRRFGVSVESCFGADWRVPEQVLTHLVTEPWQTSAHPLSLVQG